MEDRYSYDDEGPAPCNICGSPVREHLVQERSRGFGDRGKSYFTKRICQNPECDSNRGDMSLADSV
jgi:hypothetical protein